jgi:NADH-ubiquinone oxidoreductase chain 5
MFYNKYVSGIVLKLGGQTVKEMDKGIIEKFGSYGLQKKTLDISESINKLSTGVVTSYALYILVSLLFYISVIYLCEIIDNFFILGFISFSVMTFATNIKQNKLTSSLY